MTKERADILVNVLLDRSGSMAGQVPAVIEHYNGYIEELRGLPQWVKVSLSIFDTEYSELYLGKDAKEVTDLNDSLYYARGGTALLDAVGRLITSVDALKNKPSKVIFVINTDGAENSSHEYKKAQIKDIITERQNNHDWQFVFVGAGLENFDDARAMGVNVHLNTTATAGGSAYRYQTLTSSTADYAAGLSNSMADSITRSINTLGTEEEFTKKEADKKAKKAKSESPR